MAARKTYREASDSHIGVTITYVSYTFIPAKEEPAMSETETRRKGPKPNPFTRLEKAKAAAERARRKASRAIAAREAADALAAAEAEALTAAEAAEEEEQEALAALQEAVAAAAVSSE